MTSIRFSLSQAHKLSSNPQSFHFIQKNRKLSTGGSLFLFVLISFAVNLSSLEAQVHTSNPQKIQPATQQVQPATQQVQPATQQMQPATQAKSIPSSPSFNLHQTVEHYYSATQPKEMKHALDLLRKQSPNHPLRWEVEAHFAMLQLHQSQIADFAIRSLLSRFNQNQTDLPQFPPFRLYDQAISAWPTHQRDLFLKKLFTVAQKDSSPSLRTALAWTLRHRTHYANDRFGYQTSTDLLGPLLPLSIIGPWDNDQGKGLDTEYPPEKEVDLSKSYPGKIIDVSWRTQYPQDQRGKINFDELMSPTTWQVAYGAVGVQVDKAQSAHLRISTSDPVKVWVNGQMVLNLNQVDGWVFDGIQLPIALNQGVNQILIKSAQRRGFWMLTSRLTTPYGSPIDYTVVAADTPFNASKSGESDPSTPTLSKVWTEKDLIQNLQERFDPRMPARRAIQMIYQLNSLGLGSYHVEYAEKEGQNYGQSLAFQYEFALALWGNDEKGRAADLLNRLHSQYGQELPRFTDLQMRFWQEQRLSVKARETGRTLVESHPKLAQAAVLLARLYRFEGWTEEECMLLKKALKLDPHNGVTQSQWAKCPLHPSEKNQAQALLDLQKSQKPLIPLYLQQDFKKAERTRDFQAMLKVAQQCLNAWPQDQSCYRWKAYSHWKLGNTEHAFNALEAWKNLNPQNAQPYIIEGKWLTLIDQKEKALQAWKEALRRDPENQKLALRLSEMQPQGQEPWKKDIPDQKAITQAIALRDQVPAQQGANTLMLLDDEVTLLNADGSTSNVVTTVTHALNQEGRDELTKMRIGRSRSQLLAAYAISPKGIRIEASSIRDGVIRFRKLEVGSTVVVQHRNDTKPSAYLVGHIARSWWFQNANTQVKKSRWVLWMPKETPLHEDKLGDVQRTEEIIGDQKRVSWTVMDAPPVILEPRMPPLFGQIQHLEMSTVPTWEDLWKWERELLREAFRMSPEVEKKADEILADVDTPQDKVEKIHEYVIRNIRYQQDYESTIKGVKPHTAAQVLSRQYGDCKDKAVLFITLAKKAGIDVHFALVRTRDAGKVSKNIPSQQFNHAIVYVPAQEGIEKGRFYDPTVDELDLTTLRSDDQGTLSLVYNPTTHKHSWIPIEFQDESYDQTQDHVNITIKENGEIEGSLLMESRGQIGQILRLRARNPEGLKQVLEGRTSQMIAGSQMTDHKVVQVDDLTQPAQISIDFKHESWLKKEGNHFRIPNIIDWTPKRYFQLKERQYPMLLGHKRMWTWSSTFTLPPHFEIIHQPQDQTVESKCLRLERKSIFNAEKSQLKVEWFYKSVCERLSPEEYLTHKDKSREMLSLLNQEIVIAPQAIKPQEKNPVPLP